MISLLMFGLLSQTPLTAPDDALLERRAEEAGVTAAIASKLTPDQLHDVLRATPPHRQDPPAVAVIAVLGFFVTLILTVVAAAFVVSRMTRQRAETLRLMVEKGAPIPPELLSPSAKPANDLRRGLLLIFFGLGLGVFLLAVADVHCMWTLGLVPLLMGIGYVVASRVAVKPAAPPPPTPLAAT